MVKKTNKKVCQLCGKSEGKVEYYIGGFVADAHKECVKIGMKAIDFWIQKQLIMPSGLYWLSKEVIRVGDKLYAKRTEKNKT